LITTPDVEMSEISKEKEKETEKREGEELNTLSVQYDWKSLGLVIFLHFLASFSSLFSSLHFPLSPVVSLFLTSLVVGVSVYLSLKE
jgi:hypothetical protein